MNYFDPYHDYDAWKLPEMSKPFGYAYQREYRIVFRCPMTLRAPLAPEFLEVGPMADCAGFCWPSAGPKRRSRARRRTESYRFNQLRVARPEGSG